MAVSSEYVDPMVEQMQRIGRIWDLVLEGYRKTQRYVGWSEHAGSRAVEANLAAKDLSWSHMFTKMMGEQPDPEDEAQLLETIRVGKAALCAHDAAELAFNITSSRYARRMAQELAGSTVSVRIVDEKYLRFQRLGSEHGMEMPCELTGEFAGYDPLSSEMHLKTDTDTHLVRLVMPDLGGSNRLVRLAIITGVDFPDIGAA